MIPGRTCPTDYRLAPEIFERPVHLTCQTLYVAGGVYGNQWALQALDELVATERVTAEQVATERVAAEHESRKTDIQVIFNGDLHWFDITPESFATVEAMANAGNKLPLIGNVEAELVRTNDIGAGCGCAYPPDVSQDVVDRSNRIHARLKQVFGLLPKTTRDALSTRKPACTANVSGHKVAITHGDEQLLGGWGCAREALVQAQRQSELGAWLRQRAIKVLATSHTCAPALLAQDGYVVINNGAAGMPNFAGEPFGLATRISSTPHGDAIYRANSGELYVEALPLRYDQQQFSKWFDQLWPAGSPAALSYRSRIDGNIADTAKAVLA